MENLQNEYGSNFNYLQILAHRKNNNIDVWEEQHV
jgi:hypothetical protein